METTPTVGEDQGGLDRRTVLRRGAILGGALVWTVPAVQTLAGPAFAAGSPCVGTFKYTDTNGVCLKQGYKASTACCDCITTYTGLFGGNVVGAAAYCEFFIGSCQTDPATTGPC